MGREWYWSGSRSSKRGGNGVDSTTTPSGCMSAVFHFFDFHHFQFPLHHHQQPSFKPDSFLPVEPNVPKGVEAPRNSLELEETPLPSITKDEDKLNIQMGIQIKTSADTRLKVGGPNNDSSSSEISSSPGSKTPNLVARLMGLDLLPESHSPSCSSTPTLLTKSQLHHHFGPKQRPLQSKQLSYKNCMERDIIGTRSLPETPRISSARRSDVEHRLSLQINKENMIVSEDLEFSRFSSFRRKELRVHEDENKSPSHYARQIVKQVKESVSRKVGLDITNTIRSRERNELVSQFKSKKKVKVVLNKVVDESSPGKHSTPSCSPRLHRFLDTKNKTNMPTSNTKDPTPQPLKISQVNIQPQPIKVSPKPKLQPLQEEHQQRPIKKCKKAGNNDRFGPAKLKKPPQTSDIIRNKQEEPFVRAPTTCRINIPDKKCKKTPLSSDLLNITVPTLLPAKKDPSPPATKIPQKLLSSCPSQMYKQEATHKLVARDHNNDNRYNGANTITGDRAEYEYVTRILRRTGIDKDTRVSFTRWFSPSHPLDPSIFYYMEHVTTSKNDVSLGQLRLRCNRKLLFHLVDEILVGILKPYINMKPWVSTINIPRDNYSQMQGSQLIDTLCLKITSFPCADCHVLEDIDVLIDKDLPQLKQQTAIAFEEEGEGIVTEIERDIMDTLIHETAVFFCWGSF